MRSNYFEANNAAHETSASAVHYHDGRTAAPVSLCADVVLNAVPLANVSLPNVSLSASHRPCESVIIAGNYHNPAQSAKWCKHYSGIAAFGAGAVSVEANRCNACAKYILRDRRETCHHPRLPPPHRRVG